MTYKLTDDIDLKGKIDIRVVDAKMDRLLADTEFALTKQPAFNPELKTLVADLLRVFMTTHQSMRQLIKQEKKNPLLFGDAGSLCREQVEKLYVLALIIDNPDKWIRQYLRNDWQAMYEHHLLDKQEFSLLPRFQEFGELESKGLDRIRHWPNKSYKRGYYITVSERARDAVRFRFLNPNKYPTNFPSKKYHSYFYFPTPGRALGELSDPLVIGLLRRWYKEYKYFSAYTHTLGSKIGMQRIYRNKNYFSGKKQSIYRSKLVHRILFTSHIATASAITLLVQSFATDFGVVITLRQFWEQLAKASLFARLIWQGYASKLLV